MRFNLRFLFGLTFAVALTITAARHFGVSCHWDGYEAGGHLCWHTKDRFTVAPSLIEWYWSEDDFYLYIGSWAAFGHYPPPPA